MAASTTAQALDQQQRLVLSAFFLLGLLNNSLFVIMLAGAKSISDGGTALVFIANTTPSLLLKLSAPHWFHRVGYRRRICGASSLFAASFSVVALFNSLSSAEGPAGTLSNPARVGWQLAGVCLGSLGGSLGEASLLALAGRWDSLGDGSTLTAFSSGTGLAGIFGFAWKAFWNDWLGLSFSRTLVLALSLPVAYGSIYLLILDVDDDSAVNGGGVYEYGPMLNAEEGDDFGNDSRRAGANANASASGAGIDTGEIICNCGIEIGQQGVRKGRNGCSSDDDQHSCAECPSLRERAAAANLRRTDASLTRGTVESEFRSTMAPHPKEMTMSQRTRLVASLWPYMCPLFLVYWSEYTMMSGAWTAIGFPVGDRTARNVFYLYSSWTYQVGVFLSRSSGTIFRASPPILWLMPFLQLCNLVLFSLTAFWHFWYDWSLLVMCFFAGLLGGGVYVNAFTRISADVPDWQREFALGSASVADSFGVLLADVCGLFLQSCIYQANAIQGSAVSCPFHS